MPPGAYIAPAAYAYIAMPAYIPFRGAYTAVFIATLGSMAHTDIKFHGSYHQPTLSSFDNNILILTHGSNRQEKQFCDFMASRVFSKDFKQFDVFWDQLTLPPPHHPG